MLPLAVRPACYHRPPPAPSIVILCSCRPHRQAPCSALRLPPRPASASCPLLSRLPPVECRSVCVCSLPFHSPPSVPLRLPMFPSFTAWHPAWLAPHASLVAWGFSCLPRQGAIGQCPSLALLLLAKFPPTTPSPPVWALPIGPLLSASSGGVLSEAYLYESLFVLAASGGVVFRGVGVAVALV